ncbi:MAG TPA: AAA family ATPase [Acetobacteraceae bacterium]|nr:AAA family ATPase [Acetobacteraceae bacterium]
MNGDTETQWWTERDDTDDPIIMPPPSQEWQDAHGWKGGKPPPNGDDHDANDDHELPAVAWCDERLSDWADREVPDRRWIVPDWIPREQATGLYGVGGINKTDLLVQLLMAGSAGLVFIGYQLEPVPVYGLFCEDSRDEIVRRASRIAAHYHRSLVDFRNFHFASLVGFDDTEFVTFDGSSMTIGPALRHFDHKIMQTGARLAVLDTASHFFGGSEISRREVTRYLRKLDAISMMRSCAILFSAHPSVRGKAAGTFDSGSTAWEGGVRSRLSLHDPGLEGDEETGQRGPRVTTDRRILTRQKANYARQGETIELVCRNGVFTTAALDPERAAQRRGGPAHDAAVEERFLDLLTRVQEVGGHVHDASNNPSRYAPKLFAARPDGKPFSVHEYTGAMYRLFTAKRIHLEPFGPPSKARNRIVKVRS